MAQHSPLHFEPRMVDLRIDKDAIDEEYKNLTGELSDLDREQLSKTATKMAVFAQSARAYSDHLRGHRTPLHEQRSSPNGFKAMVVTYDQECCVLYKEALDTYLPPESTDVVISVSGKDKEDERYKPFRRDREAEEKLLERFRDSSDPLQILVVTGKNSSQGSMRPFFRRCIWTKLCETTRSCKRSAATNRTYGDTKTHGLIVDYLGVFDDVAKALDFDEDGMHRVVEDLHDFESKLPGAVEVCLNYFEGVDRSIGGYEGLIAAQDCLPNNEVRDAFAAHFSELTKMWEALSPITRPQRL